MSFTAKVKNVLSGDTFVLVPVKSTQVPVPERILTLSYVTSDSFFSKEFVRKLLIGKVIKFKVLYKHTTGKEFGDIQTPISLSLIEYLVENGRVKLRDNVEENDFTDNLVQLQEAAKAKKVGVWGKEKAIEQVEVPTNKSLDVIVDRVISGDRVVATVLVNKTQHASTTVTLAGIKCPRTDEPAHAKIANLAKQYVEDKFLTTTAGIKIRVIGENQAGIPIAFLDHPSGNDIHAKLLELGYGEIVDWQSSIIGSTVMSKLRKAEQTAKALGHGLYTTKASPTPQLAGKVSTKHLRPGLSIDNVAVVRVVQADTLVIKLPSNEEVTVQLASLRGPKINDTNVTSNKQVQTALVNSAREFVRQQIIGKTISVYIDGFRKANAELGFDSRFLVTVKYGNKDLSEEVVSAGWAGVIKHNKQTSDERSLNWDKLIELEEQQKQLGKNGIYFKGDITKVLTVGTRIVDCSENISRSKSFFNGLKQKGRISGYHIEFIPSTNRVRLFNPKEGLRLILILGGLTNERNEDGAAYLSKFLQRNVEFDVYDLDKIGGFIGNLYINSKPVQILLLEQGFVRTHELAVSSSSYEKEFIKAEESAKASKKGIWLNNVEPISHQLQQVKLEAKPIYSDVEVTFIDEQGVIYYQDLNAQIKLKFNAFKKEFDEFHAQVPSASTTSVDLPINLAKSPKKNDLVSVKLEDNGKYYRGRVIGLDKTTHLYEVRHLDYGNVDQVPLSSLRVLPSFYSVSVIPAFAHSFKLQHIKLPPSKPQDWLSDALEKLDELTLDKTLVISALPSTTPGVEYDVILYDSEQSLKDSSYTINKKIVSEGLALVDTVVDDFSRELKQAEQQAIAAHRGCWEYGYVDFDNEEI